MQILFTFSTTSVLFFFLLLIFILFIAQGTNYKTLPLFYVTKRTRALRILPSFVLPFFSVLSYFISLFQTFLISAPPPLTRTLPFRFPPFFPSSLVPIIVVYIVYILFISELLCQSYVKTEHSTSLTGLNHSVQDVC